jgi:hypothetical protein
MIRNFFYSIFLHLLLCLIALFFFWQQKKEQNKKPEIFTSVVFMQAKSNQAQPVIKQNISPPEIKPEPKPEPQSEPQPEPELVKQKPKPQPKPQLKPQSKSQLKPDLKPKITKNIPKSEAQKPPEKLPQKEVIKTPEIITPPPEIIAKKPEMPKPEIPLPDANKPENVGVVNLQVTQQDIEKQLSSTLSKRETFNIQAQFRACYKRALAVMIDNGQKPIAPIVVKINLNTDGYIITNLDNIIDKNQYQQNQNYKNSIDSIKKMIEFCNPIVNLAKEKYSVWQEIVLQLNENNNL